jgi:uncharacterized membrane protein YdjX (TVP38/TMEM64 family)
MACLFDRGGDWAIVLTRSFPYSVPEAMVLLTGLARTPMRKFVAAVTIGSVLTAFAFAAIGAWLGGPAGRCLCYVLPILLLPIPLCLMRLGA